MKLEISFHFIDIFYVITVPYLNLTELECNIQHHLMDLLEIQSLNCFQHSIYFLHCFTAEFHAVTKGPLADRVQWSGFRLITSPDRDNFRYKSLLEAVCARRRAIISGQSMELASKVSHQFASSIRSRVRGFPSPVFPRW